MRTKKILFVTMVAITLFAIVGLTGIMTSQQAYAHTAQRIIPHDKDAPGHDGSTGDIHDPCALPTGHLVGELHFIDADGDGLHDRSTGVRGGQDIGGERTVCLF